MARIKIFLLSLFLVGLSFQVYAQSTIWEENFDSYANFAYSGTGTGPAPNNNVQWTGVPFNYYYSEGIVTYYNALHLLSNTSTNLEWTTQQIDISNFKNVNINLDLWSTSYSNNNSLITFWYSLDGGPYVQYASAQGQWSGAKSIRIPNNISGSTLKIKIKIADLTYYIVDNIVVKSIDKTFWLRADAGLTLSGQQVSQWTDQSGNGNGVTQSTPNYQPKFYDNQIDFNPAIEFNGINEFLAGTSGGFYTDNYFIVFKPTSTISKNTSAMVLIDGVGSYASAGSDLSGLFLGNGTSAFNNEIITHGVGSASDYRSAKTGNTSYPVTAYLANGIENAQANNEDIYLNGTKINNAQSGSYLKESNIVYYLGGRGDYLNTPMYFSGQIAEILDYNGTINERLQVQSYLALKYGITLTTDNYYNSSGTLIYDRSTYGNNIAGLGYDSNFNLNQKVSSSVNTNNTQSSDITIATTADFTSSNQATGRTPLTDGQYLIWGDDNGQTTSWLTDGSYKRVGRWWKIQNTGTVGQVNIQINLSSYPAPTSSVYTLVVDNDANLSDGGLKDGIVLTAGANNHYTATVTFPAGTTYFTIADVPKLSLSASITNTIKCNGGTDGAISANATGGVGNYIFYLNNVQTTFPISTLSAGTYDVKVTSGSESQSQTITLTEPGKMMNTPPDITNVKCQGDNTGAIDIHIPYPIQFSSSTKDYINLGSSLLNSLSSFTMEGWIKFNKNDLAGLGRVGLFGQNDIIEFGFINSTTLYIWTANGGSCSVNLSNYPSDNDWHHIAVVGTATQLTIYIDGAQQGISTHTSISTYGTSSYPVTMGGYVYDAIGASNSNSFPGEIRKVGFWNRALSQAEIQNIANTNIDYSGSESNLIAGYNFFEGAGNSVAPVGTATAKGTFGNSATWDTNLYSFQWSKAGTAFATTEDVNGISAGDYSLTINNSNGCSQTEIYTVTEPSTPFIVTLTATPSVHDACIGTQISLSSSVTGGTSPYNDDFMIGASTVQSGTLTTYDYNTVSGTQNITVKTIDANGCATTSSGYTVTGSNTPTTGVIVKN